MFYQTVVVLLSKHLVSNPYKYVWRKICGTQEMVAVRRMMDNTMALKADGPSWRSLQGNECRNLGYTESTCRAQSQSLSDRIRYEQCKANQGIDTTTIH